MLIVFLSSCLELCRLCRKAEHTSSFFPAQQFCFLEGEEDRGGVTSKRKCVGACRALAWRLDLTAVVPRVQP